MPKLQKVSKLPHRPSWIYMHQISLSSGKQHESIKRAKRNVLSEYFLSYDIWETTRNVCKKHFIISCRQKLKPHSQLLRFQPLGKICKNSYLIKFVHVIWKKIYYLASGSFCHSYVTETKCLKNAKQSQIVTAYTAQHTDTYETQYTNTTLGQKILPKGTIEKP